MMGFRLGARSLALAVTATLVLASSAAADVVNGSFEDGTLNGWSTGLTGGTATTATGGAPGGGSTYAQVTAGNANQYQTISQSFPAVAGDVVSASAGFNNGESANECTYDDDAFVVIQLNGKTVASFFSASSCTSAAGFNGWVTGSYKVPSDGAVTVVAGVRNVADALMSSQVWLDGVMQAYSKRGFCAAAGNTNPYTGASIAPGTFLELRADQPLRDDNYKGATPANFVAGTGITCDSPPTGYVQDGFAGEAQHVGEGFYPYFKPAA